MYQIRLKDSKYSMRFDNISNKIVVTIDAEEFMNFIEQDEELTDVLLVVDKRRMKNRRNYERSVSMLYCTENL